MTSSLPADFLSGVIEGFYGAPWNPEERSDLLRHLADSGLNTYMYGPKDDLHHRVLWRQPYAGQELSGLTDFIGQCRQQQIHFLYALAPGLDIRFSDPSELERLKDRCAQLLAHGCQHVAVLFDDIPDSLSAADRLRWTSPASAQASVVNALWAWLRTQSPDVRLFFCPTPYCLRMAQAGLGGPDYLSILGRELQPEIDIFWTGPEIISREITVSHVREIGALFRRPPLIWDNLHANDYDGRRFFCGPYSGRPPELRREIRGILSNPNCEYPLNFVPLRTLGRYVHTTGTWNEREEYLRAMGEWQARFDTFRGVIDLDDLVRFGDCHYLPYSGGPEADRLFKLTHRLLGSHPTTWGASADEFMDESRRWRGFFARLTELTHRPLYHALLRRIWDLREEIDLLARYVDFKSRPGQADLPFQSDYHLPGTYRGGMITRLQTLLNRQPDGSLASGVTGR